MAETKKDRMMRKVRALLTQAEDPAATPEEAEAFSRKAEELIAQYAIDVALLEDKRKTARGKPTTRRVATEKNYRMPYAQILIDVAQALGVKPIFEYDRKFVILVGFESDLDVVETLYGSLLLQATNAMIHDGKAGGFIGDDLWRFKQSFLVGFAQRVGERLRELHQQKVEEAKPGAALVLADRRGEVEKEFAELFPQTKKLRGPSVGSGAGYASGQVAGSKADVGGRRFEGGKKAIA